MTAAEVEEDTESYSRTALARHLLYFAALVGLFFVCRRGQQSPVVITALVVYVVASTLVVRRQYVTWMSPGEPQTPPYGPLCLLLTLGLLFVGFGFVGSWVIESRWMGYLLFPGVVASYLAAGGLMTRARTVESAERQTAIGRGSLAACCALIGIGLGLLALFENLPGWLAGVAALCLALGMVFFPVGVALLAERAVDRYYRQWDSSRQKVVVVYAGGVVMSLAAAVVIGVVYDAMWLSIVLMVIAGVVFAIVSGTLADVCAVLGVIALMGVTPQSEPIPAALNPGEGQRVLVAIGDSYMSGEGADTYYEGTDIGGENQCRRAPTAWAVQAAQRYFDGLVFLACSGARTYNVRHDVRGAETPEPRPQTGEGRTQLDEYAARQAASGFVPGLVVINIGGNDAGFSTIGKACAVPGSCDTEDMRNWFTDELPQVEKELQSTFGQVREVFAETDTPIAVTAYPDPIYLAEGETEPCDDLALSGGDVRFIKDFLTKLNLAVEAAATANGFAFIPQTGQAFALAGIQLCDPVNGSRPGVNFVGLRSVSGLADQRFNPANWIHNSFHPNERGHAALLRAFDTWWAETGSLLKKPAPVPAGVDPVDGVVIEPQCDLVGNGLDAPQCRSNADAWTIHKLAQAAFPGAFLVLLVAVPAWFASCALFGWRRRARLGPPA